MANERVTTLEREIGMLQQIQPNLRGIPARQNLLRIADRMEELATLQYAAEIETRFGSEEIARCERIANSR